MKKVISKQVMKNSDEYTIKHKSSELDLMDNAAKAVLESYQFKGKVLIVAGTGNNAGDGYALALHLYNKHIDVNILSRVINRGLLTAGRLSHLTIELLDKPGQLKDVSTTIAEYGANVIRVRHNQGGGHTDIDACFLQISMETKNTQHFQQIKQALIDKGYKIISDN